VKTRILKSTTEYCLDRALEILESGGIVAFPTDTVYGIGTSAFNNEAVLSLFEAKGRSRMQAVPVLISSMAQIDTVTTGLSDLARSLAEKYWPGPITLVLSKNTNLAEAVSPSDTVGVRMPKHEFAKSLLDAVGLLAVTSANITGHKSLSGANEVFQAMKGKIELVIDGGKTPGQVPSTVVDCTGMKPVIIREGPISQAEIDLFISSKG
jgi:L-threonylcarbamoyladenylate synthase